MKKVNNSNHRFIINVSRGDRWQTYHRLKELGIPCKCSTGMPLEVSVETPTSALQVWSVARQQLGQRSQMINWLDRCFDSISQVYVENLTYD